jgi:hypothetical protein
MWFFQLAYIHLLAFSLCALEDELLSHSVDLRPLNVCVELARQLVVSAH